MRACYLLNVVMKRLSLLLFLISYSFCSLAQSDSLLSALKRTIEEKNSYVNARIAAIARIKQQLASTPPASLDKIFDLTNRLFFAYRVFVYDSAIFYATELKALGTRMGDLRKTEYAKLKTAYTLNSAGFFKETFDSARFIHSKLLDDSSKSEFYSLMARANYDLGEFDNNRHFFEKYINIASKYLDSCLILNNKESYSYLDASWFIVHINQLKQVSPGVYKNLPYPTARINEGLQDLKKLIASNRLTEHQKAIANHHLGIFYLKTSDTLRAIDAFMISAMHDIKASVKETTSMAELANLLYRRGDIENAYLFIKEAMDDALYYGARQRKARIGSLLPIIAAEHISRSEQQKKTWLTYSITATVVVALTLFFIFITRRQYKKLKEADQKVKEANARLQEINHRLREADKIKEEYIGYYFNINSDYLDKIETLKKSIDQKLTARKFDDLRFVTDSFDLKRERENLYAGFDSTFVKLFPDFVSTFQSYFTEQNKFQLKDGQLLNTEMRIFALIRLGIHDTDKIAKILGYSVNTIYAYKTKVKSKSLLPNEEFEAKILEIKTV